MKENVPGSHGEQDRGTSPGDWPRRPQNGWSEGDASFVRIRDPHDGGYPSDDRDYVEGGKIKERYSRAEVAEIVRRGELDPRRLTLAEEQLTKTNREQADGDLQAVLQQS